MEIIHHLKSDPASPLKTIRGSRRPADFLDANEKQLLQQVTQTFYVITGGNFKTRRQSA
jgi:hypothetical protein